MYYLWFDYSNNTSVFVATRNGYGLWYDVSSVSVVGIRASGVKSIKLKDDYVVSSCLFDPECEYATIITDKSTAKRLKLSLIEKTSRANRGVLLMKEIKSNPSKIIACYLVPSKDEIEVVSTSEVKRLKLTEISIMDKQSNGSFIAKDKIIDIHMVCGLVNNDSLVNNVNEDDNIEDKIVVSKEYKSLKNIDDKMLSIDEYLDDIEN